MRPPRRSRGPSTRRSGWADSDRTDAKPGNPAYGPSHQHPPAESPTNSTAGSQGPCRRFRLSGPSPRSRSRSIPFDWSRSQTVDPRQRLPPVGPTLRLADMSGRRGTRTIRPRKRGRSSAARPRARTKLPPPPPQEPLPAMRPEAVAVGFPDATGPQGCDQYSRRDHDCGLARRRRAPGYWATFPPHVPRIVAGSRLCRTKNQKLRCQYPACAAAALA